MYLLGYDIGSSTIKAALVKADTRELVCLTQYPDKEMDMISRQRGWAEQQPELWWQHFCIATQRLLDQSGVKPETIKAIGIAYQMHGLVLIDKDQQVLRPSIIWCDSRAVQVGERAMNDIGEDYCLNEMLNSPGNFTASKLKWVKDNEPEIYEKAHRLLLPGDFIAMKLTGEAVTTISGLTEGIFWNFKKKEIDTELLDYYGLREDLIAPTVPTFSIQGELSERAASLTGLRKGIPVTYRAGDQPNNALALNVLHPGEVAATSGTSGVVYGIVDRPAYDTESRVNAFAHVNYEQTFDRIGILLCLNGAGIQYSWIKNQVARGSHTYEDMERMASTVPVGSDSLCVLPFGNGAERMLNNRELNANFFNLQFNRHTRGHLYRAALEGVAFSFAYGINILKEMDLNIDVIRVANDNMFQSKIFSSTLATLLDLQIEVVDTTGAIGAARAAGIAAGIYRNLDEALANQVPHLIHEPVYNKGLCDQAYSYWLANLEKTLSSSKGFEKSNPELVRQKNKLDKEIKKKNQELAIASLQKVANNDFLNRISHELGELLENKDAKDVTQVLKKIKLRLDRQIDESDWNAFEDHFNLLHSDFFKKLKDSRPNLSIPELKMCAYLKMGLSNKQMAQKLNLSLRGVETRRYRLGKKLSNNLKLADFIQQL